MKKLLLYLILALSAISLPISSFATVSSTTSKVVYTGDGVSSSFSFSFNIYKNTDLVVQKILISTGVATTLVLNSDYTVTLTHSSPTPGAITLSTGALASTFQLVILRTLPLTQLINITDPYYTTPAATWNEAHDRSTMLSQQLQEQLSRSILGPTTSSTTITLPAGVAGQCLGWDGTGTQFTNLTCSGSSGGGGGSAFNPPIADSQLQAITTASKVNGSAIYSLSSVPSGAGLLPIANIPVGTSASSIVQLNGSAQLPAVSGVNVTNVSGANLVSLGSTPSGSGVLPVANLATGTPTGSKFVRDDGTLAVPVSTSSFSLVSNTSFSAATNTGDIAITNTKYYLVIINVTSLSAADSLTFLFNNDTTANKYGYVNRGFNMAATAVNANSNMGAAGILIGPSMVQPNGGATDVSVQMYIFPQRGTAQLAVQGRVLGDFNASTTFGMTDFSGLWNNAAAATSFRITTTGGATMAGNVLLYALSQS